MKHYFYNNEPISSISHFVGFGLAIAALPVLIVFAVQKGTPWHVVTYTIFGTSMILLYCASAVYHLFSKHIPAKRVLQIIDHSMIYILIAGTYTPVCLTVLRGGWGWSLFGIVWGLAIVGVCIKSFQIKIPDWFSALLYVLMGWIIIIAAPVLFRALSPFGVWWLFAGGVSYTVGVIFFALEKVLPRKGHVGMHEVFHVFVMMGSFAHFWLMIKHIVIQ